MEESLDGSDAESNYSGISNEDFEEADEDVEEQDAEPLSSTEEESEAEDMSTADVEEGFPADDDVLYVENAEEVLSVSDDGDVLSATHPEDVHPESDADFVMSASDADDFVPTANVVLSEDGSEGAVADLTHYVKEEQMNASDMEPTYDEDFEELDLKQESLASDAELLPSTCKESGQSRKSSFRGQDGAVKHGKLSRRSKCEDKVCTTESSGYGTHTLSRELIRESKSQANNAQWVLPAPFSGPRASDGRLYHCYFCRYSNSKKSQLMIHMAVHYQVSGKRCRFRRNLKKHLPARMTGHMYKCHLCEFKSENPESLKDHLTIHKRSVKKVAKLSCFHCEWTTGDKYSLVRHIKAEHLKERFNCLLCNYTVKLKHILKAHYAVHHTGKKVYACPLCNFENFSSEVLKNHMETHSSESNFQCPLCFVSITEVDSFSDHMMLTHVDARSTIDSNSQLENGESSAKSYVGVGEKSYSCQFCQQICATREDFVTHMRTHGRENNFKCSHCPYSTHNNTILNEHINGKHTKEIQYACDFCDYKGWYKSNLRAHINYKHTRTKWYKCRFCPFQSPLHGSTASHELIHVNNRKFACDSCEFKTISLKLLQNHKLTHTGERLFKCDMCSFDAYKERMLRRHKTLVHSSKRPYVCTFCSNAYKTRGYLEIHEKMHRGRDPLQCSKCTFQTLTDFTLRKHVLKMHPARRKLQDLPDTYPNGRKKSWYPCKECAYITCSKPSLESHVKKRHPNVNKLSNDSH